MKEFKRFWQRLNDSNQPPCSWWHPPEKILCFENIERWQRQHDDVSKTLRRIMLTLLGYCLFCIFTLGSPDAQLLSENATIKMPFAGIEISYRGFLIFGPVILIAISIYLHIFLGYWHKISCHEYSDSLPLIFNINSRSAHILSTFIFYWLPYLVLWAFMWKAIPRPEGFYFLLMNTIVGLLLVFLYIRRNHLRLIKTKNGNVFHAVLWIAMLILLFDFIRISFVTDHNEFTEKFTKLRQLNLNRADLSQHYLTRLKLTRARIIRTNFREANLSQSVLDGAMGYEVIFKKSKMVNASLKNASLSSSNFDGADLTRANLNGVYLGFSSLSGATLTRADISFANLINTKLNKAKLLNAKLIKTDLLRADLSSADLTYANLSGARLALANLHNTIFSNADLTLTNLLEVKGLTCRQLKSAKNWESSYRDSKLACGSKIPALLPSLKKPPYHDEKWTKIETQGIY